LAACQLLSKLTFDSEGALSLVSPVMVLVEVESDHEDQQKANSDAHGASNRHHISNAQALLPLPSSSDAKPVTVDPVKFRQA
jgi:hypothetical protein